MTDQPASVALERINPSDLEHVDPKDLDHIARLGMWMAAAESKSNDPKAKGMAAALRIAAVGAMGLPPWAAGDVHFIDGNVQLSSRMKRALAPSHGLHVKRVAEGEDYCTAAVVVIETGVELGRYTYTLEMAQQEGLAGKHNWKKIPDRMLWARASGRVIDDFAPWLSMGLGGHKITSEALAAEGGPEDIDIPFGEVVEEES